MGKQKETNAYYNILEDGIEMNLQQLKLLDRIRIGLSITLGGIVIIRGRNKFYNTPTN